MLDAHHSRYIIVSAHHLSLNKNPGLSIEIGINVIVKSTTVLKFYDYCLSSNIFAFSCYSSYRLIFRNRKKRMRYLSSIRNMVCAMACAIPNINFFYAKGNWTFYGIIWLANKCGIWRSWTGQTIRSQKSEKWKGFELMERLKWY